MPRLKQRDPVAEMIAEAERTEQTVSPRCRHFGACGGCDLQRLPYPAQLRLKRRLVESAMAAYPQTAGCTILDVLPAPAEWGYRNKAELAFATSEEGALVLGYSPKLKWWERVDVQECWLCSARMMGAALAVKGWAARAALAAYDQRRHVGFLRHLALRESAATGDFLVNLVTAEGQLPEAPLADAVRPFAPTGVTRTVSTTPGLVVAFERIDVLFGEPLIRERAAGLDFVLSPQSFFQTNSAMVSRLMEVVAQAAEGRGEPDGPGPSPAPTGCKPVRVGADPQIRPGIGRMLDLFCGVGTIGLVLASGMVGAHGVRPFTAEGGCATEVIGVEAVEAAVLSARENARINRLANARFVCSTARAYLRDPKGEVFDLVAVDPPRPGCGPRVIKRLLEMRAPRIVYVSCNPRALAAELAALSAAYDIGPIQPVDLFPQTAHVEAVVGLTARAEGS